MLGFAAIVILGAIATWGTSSSSKGRASAGIDINEITQRATNLPVQHFDAF